MVDLIKTNHRSTLTSACEGAARNARNTTSSMASFLLFYVEIRDDNIHRQALHLRQLALRLFLKNITLYWKLAKAHNDFNLLSLKSFSFNQIHSLLLLNPLQ